MSLSIFWRLIFSHLGILLLFGAASLYSIVQLGSLSGTARSALDRDHRMIHYQEALTDAFLSQVRYGGKYLITHVEGRRDQMRQFKRDFSDYSTRLAALGQSEQIPASIARIERWHARYHELFDREVEYIRARQSYAQSRFQQERDKIIESALNELDSLKAHLRTKLREKLEGIEQRARTARRIAMLTILVVFVLGSFLSFKVSKDFAETAASATPVAPFGHFSLGASIDAMKRFYPALKPRRGHLPPWALACSLAWNRCLTLWKNPGARKGG